MKTIQMIVLTIMILAIFTEKGVAQLQILQLKPDGSVGVDAYINSVSYAQNQNYGMSQSLIACSWTYGGEAGVGTSYFKFDLTQIPSHSSVISARLNLFYDPLNSWYYQCGNNACYIRKVLEPWDEDKVTWVSQPTTSKDNEVFLPVSVYTNQDYLGIDVTQLVQQMIQYPAENHGFALEMIDLMPYTCMMFASSDHESSELWPEIEIEYQTCEELSVDYTFTQDGFRVLFNGISENATSWHWDFGNGYQSSIQNPEMLYASEGIYNVCLYVEDECGVRDSICKQLEVCKNLTAEFDYLNLNGTYYAFNDSSVNAISWFWSFDDGFFSDLQNPVHFFNNQGSYNVCLLVGSDCYSDTICKRIIVSTYGISLETNSSLIINPNPSNSDFFIKFDKSSCPIKIRLISISGNELLKFDNPNPEEEIIIPKQEKGIYTLQFIFPDKVLSRKIIAL